MENYVTDQLVSFLRAGLLGLTAGALYDLLRAIRRRGGSGAILTHLLDVVYVLSAMLTVFLFALQQGEGELRLYMALAIILGLSFYFLVFSNIFLPLWSFWVNISAKLLTLLWAPLAIFLRLGKNFQIYIKKLFYFWHKCATIGK